MTAAPSTTANSRAAAPDKALVDAIDEYLQAVERGLPFDRDAFLAQHAEIAAQLQECLEGLEFVQGVSLHLPSSELPRATAKALPSENFPGAKLGDYRLLREIGRGGMGIVYEAVQLSFGRTVALKMLPYAAVLDPRNLQRFRNEALAAANLDHPNIVDVLGVGCERGVHFYVMRLVDGATLAEVISKGGVNRGQGTAEENAARQAQGSPQADDPSSEVAAGRSLGPERDADSQGTPSSAAAEIDVLAGRSLGLESSLQPPASSLRPAPDTARVLLDTTAAPRDFFPFVARLGIQAAEALEHAHEMGVVHRDIKPSNLLVDARGKLWVTDFGLAQVESSATLTLPGDVLGTLRYMSPEQAAGRPTMVDHRTDIYSLGATLYELTTGQPVVRGEDRAAILREIEESEPTAPRKFAPAMPVDLETVLLKCLAKDPSARYDSAQGLADDLRRFLEHKPVVARRPERADRLWRWCRRNPVVASLAVALLAAVCLGLVGTTYGWFKSSERAEEYRALLYRAEIATALQAWEAGDAQKVQELLLRHVPENGQRDLRGFEWYYLWRTVNDTGVKRTFRHDEPVVQIAFLKDGRRLAARTMRGQIRILDTLDGYSRRPTVAEFASALPADFHGGLNNWAYYDRLNDTVEAIERNTIAAAMFKAKTSLPLGGAGDVVSPAGDLLATGAYASEVHLTDLAKCSIRCTLNGNQGVLFEIAFSPDGERLATAGNDGTVVLWSTGDGDVIGRIPAHAGPCTSIAFSSNGRWLASGGRDEKIRIWDSSTFAEVHSLETHGDTNCLEFSRDGQRLAAAGNARLVHLWNVDGWRRQQSFKGHSGQIQALRFSPDGQRLASSARNGDVIIWDVNAESPDGPGLTFSGEARALAFHPRNDLLACGSWDGTIRLWDARRHSMHTETAPQAGRVLSLAFNPTGDLLAAVGDDKAIFVFETADGTLRSRLQLADKHYAVTFTPDGDLLALSWAKSISLWRTEQYSSARDVSRPAVTFATEASPQAFAVSHDGTRLLVGSGDPPMLQLYDLRRRVLLTSNDRHRQGIQIAAASPRARLFATGDEYGTVGIWDSRDLTCRHLLSGHSNFVIGLAFSPTEDILASASLDGTVRLWDTVTGAERAVFTGHILGASSVAFSCGGDMLAIGDLKGYVRLFTAASAAQVALDMAKLAPDRAAAPIRRKVLNNNR